MPNPSERRSYQTELDHLLQTVTGRLHALAGAAREARANPFAEQCDRYAEQLTNFPVALIPDTLLRRRDLPSVLAGAVEQLLAGTDPAVVRAQRTEHVIRGTLNQLREDDNPATETIAALLATYLPMFDNSSLEEASGVMWQLWRDAESLTERAQRLVQHAENIALGERSPAAVPAGGHTVRGHVGVDTARILITHESVHRDPDAAYTFETGGQPSWSTGAIRGTSTWVEWAVGSDGGYPITELPNGAILIGADVADLVTPGAAVPGVTLEPGKWYAADPISPSASVTFRIKERSRVVPLHDARGHQNEIDGFRIEPAN